MGVVAVHTGARDEGGSLVQRSVQAVTDYIRDQGLRVGDSLPGEAFFATSLGVSRAVMREAFGAMAALRLIDVGNGRKPVGIGRKARNTCVERRGNGHAIAPFCCFGIG